MTTSSSQLPPNPAQPRPFWHVELAEMTRLGAPIVFTQLAWIAMLTTDTAMIGRLGPDALAGASLSLMVFFMTWVFCFGVVMATAALASQAFGARKPRMIRRVIRQGFWVTVILTVPSMIAFQYTPDLLRVMSQPPEILPHADAYMSTLMWSLMPSIGFAVVRNFISSLNRPSPALWVMLAGVPLNGLLDYALIFGNFGMPRLELVGAGIATSVINWLMFLVLLAIAVFAKPFRRYGILGRFWRPDWFQFRQIFLIGLPIAAMSLLEAGFFFSSIFIVGQFGAHAIAATMIALQMPHITFMVPMGLGQAATVRVGQAVGRGDVQGAYRSGWVALIIALAFMSVMTAILLAIPETFASIYLDGNHPDSSAVLALAASYLIYAAFFQAADGIQAVAAGALRGLSDTTWPMVIAAFSYWGIGLTSGLALAFWGGYEAAGLWMGFVVGLTCAAILLTYRFRRLQKRDYIPPVQESDADQTPRTA